MPQVKGLQAQLRELAEQIKASGLSASKELTKAYWETAKALKAARDARRRRAELAAREQQKTKSPP